MTTVPTCSRSGSSRASPSGCGWTARRWSVRPGRAAAADGVFLPERLELVRGGPSLRRAHLDQFAAALRPALADLRAAYARALAQRNALVGRNRAGVAAAACSTPGIAELARHGIGADAGPRRAPPSWREPFRALRGASSACPSAPTAYRPRSKATSADELRAELAERREADLAARLHRPRPAPGRARCWPRRPPAARVRLAGPAARRPARPAAGRARGARSSCAAGRR